jgi:hypothetical protein
VESAETFKDEDKQWIMTQIRQKHTSCEAFDMKLKLQVSAQLSGADSVQLNTEHVAPS